VAKFVTPLSEIADILVEKLEESRDEDGNIGDIRDFTVKWSFQGVYDAVHYYALCMVCDTEC
jgi:hypothetical protein